ncbi:MAG: hypothetical protein AAF357_15455 [Verrucomicrobiota bacterium]
MFNPYAEACNRQLAAMAPPLAKTVRFNGQSWMLERRGGSIVLKKASRTAAPGQMSLFGGGHHEGETKQENGKTYRLNANSRWELVKKEYETAANKVHESIKGKTHSQLQDSDPELDLDEVHDAVAEKHGASPELAQLHQSYIQQAQSSHGAALQQANQQGEAVSQKHVDEFKQQAIAIAESGSSDAAQRIENLMQIMFMKGQIELGVKDFGIEHHHSLEEALNDVADEVFDEYGLADDEES